MSWNPTQYLRFAEPRLRPALDLLARIAIESPGHVCDLGCGTGNVTAWLQRRWPEAHFTGIDGSSAMLAKARLALPNVHWQQADIGTWQPPQPPQPAQAPDLIFSNAALHWLPHHEQLLPRLLAGLAPGGVLAVQMPRNFDAPSHTAIADTVHDGPWRERLTPLLVPAPVAEPAAYHDMLAPIASELDIWQTEYLQVLSGPDPVKEWTKGTWLRQFLDALPESQAAAFEAAYAARVRAAYPMRADGKTLFPFRRLFIVARRAA